MMIESYTVCAYCYNPFDEMAPCSCFLQGEQPKRLLIRYTDPQETGLKNDPLDILGGAPWNEPYGEVSLDGLILAKVFPVANSDLCDECEDRLLEACAEVGSIINNCVCSEEDHREKK